MEPQVFLIKQEKCYILEMEALQYLLENNCKNCDPQKKKEKYYKLILEREALQ